jgi:hypothetical protein
MFLPKWAAENQKGWLSWKSRPRRGDGCGKSGKVLPERRSADKAAPCRMTGPQGPRASARSPTSFHPMKFLLPALRHLLTFAAGLGTVIATSAPQDQAGGVDPRAAGLGALAAVLVRFLLSLAPVTGAGACAKSGRLPGWVLAAGLAGFCGWSLPACSPAAFPQVRARYSEPGTSVEYSSAKGVLVTVERNSRK